jgi:hypothetical protein
MGTREGVAPDPALRLLELYDEALPHVYGYLLARCRDVPLAEDLTAETFLDALPVPEVADCLGRTVHATEALLVRARAAGGTADPAARRPYGLLVECVDDQGAHFQLWQPVD